MSWFRQGGEGPSTFQRAARKRRMVLEEVSDYPERGLERHQEGEERDARRDRAQLHLRRAHVGAREPDARVAGEEPRVRARPAPRAALEEGLAHVLRREQVRRERCHQAHVHEEPTEPAPALKARLAQDPPTPVPKADAPQGRPGLDV